MIQETRKAVIEGLRVIWTWAACDAITSENNEKIMGVTSSALALLEILDVEPEELERLKLCRHKCKVDCLLEHFNKVVEERDELLADRMACRMKEAPGADELFAEDGVQRMSLVDTCRKVALFGHKLPCGLRDMTRLQLAATLLIRDAEYIAVHYAREMTLEEVESAWAGLSPVWLDLKGIPKEDFHHVGYRLMRKSSYGKGKIVYEFVGASLGYDENHKAVDYNKKWCCWTNKPTEEQRRAKKWEA